MTARIQCCETLHLRKIGTLGGGRLKEVTEHCFTFMHQLRSEVWTPEGHLHPGFQMQKRLFTLWTTHTVPLMSQLTTSQKGDLQFRATTEIITFRQPQPDPSIQQQRTGIDELMSKATTACSVFTSVCKSRGLLFAGAEKLHSHCGKEAASYKKILSSCSRTL